VVSTKDRPETMGNCCGRANTTSEEVNVHLSQRATQAIAAALENVNTLDADKSSRWWRDVWVKKLSLERRAISTNMAESKDASLTACWQGCFADPQQSNSLIAKADHVKLIDQVNQWLAGVVEMCENECTKSDPITYPSQTVQS
jgi:hypothetical protein